MGGMRLEEEGGGGKIRPWEREGEEAKSPTLFPFLSLPFLPSPPNNE